MFVGAGIVLLLLLLIAGGVGIYYLVNWLTS